MQFLWERSHFSDSHGIYAKQDVSEEIEGLYIHSRKGTQEGDGAFPGQ